MGVSKRSGVGEEVNKPKISVIMAHYKREELLYRTLWGYRYFHTPEELGNVEFVIVDDGGGESETFWKVIKFHSYALKITAAAMNEKTSSGKETHNTSGPMNFGIKLAIGDLFVFTNPENIPMVSQLLPRIYRLMSDKKGRRFENRHLSGNCYSLDKPDTDRFGKIDCTNRNDFLKVLRSFMPFLTRPFGMNGSSTGWRQHSEFKPNHFFFLSSIWRESLFKLGGFDEKFLQGQGGEDVDFANRVKKMEMELFHTDNLVVLHQFHYGPGCHKLQPERKLAIPINKRTRLENEKSNEYSVNIGKEWGQPKSAKCISRWWQDIESSEKVS